MCESRARFAADGALLHAAGVLVPVLLQARLRSVLLQVGELLRVYGSAALAGNKAIPSLLIQEDFFTKLETCQLVASYWPFHIFLDKNLESTYILEYASIA